MVVRHMLAAVRHERTAVTTMVSSLHEAMHQGLDKTEAIKIWRQLLAVETSFLTPPVSQEIRDEGRAEGEIKGLTCNDPGQQQ